MRKHLPKLKYLWGILILILCLLPGSEFPPIEVFPHFDKLIHAYLYGQWMWFFLRWEPIITDKKLVSILSFFVIYGISIELIQHFFIANRSFEWADLAANLFGCTFVGTWMFLRK
jgi:VanZ family protein